jgi:hypothetical protein
MSDFDTHSRAIWALWNAEAHDGTRYITLASCPRFTKPDDHVGYMRLGRSGAPDPSHIALIPLVGHFGDVHAISWDGDSGRICLVYTPPESETDNLMMIDLLPS